MRLLQRLPASVVRRVHRERHAAPSWITLVPEGQRLTDGDLQEFTRSLTGAALLAMFRYCTLVDKTMTMTSPLMCVMFHFYTKVSISLRRITHIHAWPYSHLNTYMIGTIRSSVLAHT